MIILVQLLDRRNVRNWRVTTSAKLQTSIDEGTMPAPISEVRSFIDAPENESRWVTRRFITRERTPLSRQSDDFAPVQMHLHSPAEVRWVVNHHHFRF